MKILTNVFVKISFFSFADSVDCIVLCSQYVIFYHIIIPYLWLTVIHGNSILVKENCFRFCNFWICLKVNQETQVNCELEFRVHLFEPSGRLKERIGIDSFETIQMYIINIDQMISRSSIYASNSINLVFLSKKYNNNKMFQQIMIKFQFYCMFHNKLYVQYGKYFLSFLYFGFYFTSL